MLTRVTGQTMVRSAHRNLQGSMAELAKLQDKAMTLQKISRPSDDPIGAANSMRVRGEQRLHEQYARNITDGLGWLTTVDSALAATTDLLHQARDLTVQGANDGSLSPTAREAIAVKLVSLKDELLNQANTSFQGRNVFAGNTDVGAAFGSDPVGGAYSFTGNSSTVERRVGAETTVRVDANGADVFGDGPGSVFALIDTIVADLRSGVNIGPRLTKLDSRMNAILGQHGAVGARHAQLLRAEEMNMEQSGALEAQRSEIEDADLGKLILELKLQEVTYQAALAVTARTLQPTLMDFLR